MPDILCLIEDLPSAFCGRWQAGRRGCNDCAACLATWRMKKNPPHGRVRAGWGGLGPGEKADQALSRTQSAAQASERAWAAAPLVISHTSEPVAKVRGTRARITEIMGGLWSGVERERLLDDQAFAAPQHKPDQAGRLPRSGITRISWSIGLRWLDLSLGLGLAAWLLRRGRRRRRGWRCGGCWRGRGSRRCRRRWCSRGRRSGRRRRGCGRRGRRRGCGRCGRRGGCRRCRRGGCRRRSGCRSC